MCKWDKTNMRNVSVIITNRYIKMSLWASVVTATLCGLAFPRATILLPWCYHSYRGVTTVKELPWLPQSSRFFKRTSENKPEAPPLYLEFGAHGFSDHRSDFLFNVIKEFQSRGDGGVSELSYHFNFVRWPDPFRNLTSLFLSSGLQKLKTNLVT